ncbi:MAG: acyl-CoA dehydrogenase [Acidobacteriota bacterium]
MLHKVLHALSRKLFDTLRSSGAVPAMSATEREALEAGDTWLDAELFSGRPDFGRMLDEAYPRLTRREQAFLDGPVREVCAAMDPDELERTKEVPAAVWQLLREHRLFGLGIPEEHGGHGFSALCQSTVFGMLASRSPALSSVVLIPNSVGPGELLVEVGTAAQKEYYLPRLARGDEIPCFALTEPQAGSDAGALTSRGVVFRGDDGAPWIRLDWDKRYITLAPIATLLGLAVRLEDPDDLLGRGTAPGITCVLVPTDLPGVEVGARHDPLGIPFPNGPTRGRGVVVSAEQIIGGPAYAGRGWQMLMEALSGGRAVSLPAQATAGAKHVARVAGAYSMVRQQFGMPIGRFEGIEEPLARLAGLAYLMEAARVFTCGALAAGHRPAVVSAIMKYNTTELQRALAADGMDIVGGAGICRGPRNLLADAYTAAPIGITVEGANILTRTLIVFGQGALRCHPHAFDLLESLRAGDADAFGRALVRHQKHVGGNFLRALRLGLTRGRLAPKVFTRHRRSPTTPYFRKLAWASARFAFWADVAMAVYGGRLKTRGKLTGRFADVLSWMYLTAAVLRRYEAEGRLAEDQPLARWAAEYGLTRVQEAFEGLFANFDVPLLGLLARGPVLWWCRANPLGREPSDRLGTLVAGTLQRPDERRERLTGGLYVHPGSAFDTLETAFRLAHDSAPAATKVRRAIRAGRLPKKSVDALARDAVAAGVLSDDEATLLEQAAAARAEAIRVDEMSLQELRGEHQQVEEPTSHRDALEPVAVG